jgi:DNA-directed RNA polymerase subunit F
MTKKLQFKIEGQEQINWVEKTHAEVFRKFWNYFKELDIVKTIETIEICELRTANEPVFVAKNGSKKKHVQITEHLWIYSHLTPKAMEKQYEKFLKGWKGEIAAPSVDDVTAMPETEDDLSVINAAIDQEIEILNAYGPQEYVEPEIIEPEEIETVIELTAEEIAKNELAQEEYGVNFADLIPTQKGKITKLYKKSLTTESQEEMDLPQM